MCQNICKIDPREIGGLKMFLFVVLDLIKSGKKETCRDIEDNISLGITKYLGNKYNAYFNKYYNRSNDDNIDEFYRLCNHDGIDEFFKSCDNKFDRNVDDGLYWLIEQVLNCLH